MIPHFFTLLTRPDKAWTDIRRDEEKNSSNYLVHLLLWALLPAICMFIGTRYVGWSLVENERIWLDTRSAFQLSLLIYLTIILGTFIMGFFLRWMSRTFDARPTFNQCVGFTAYVITPFFLAGLGALYPTRWIAILVIVAAGVYRPTCSLSACRNSCVSTTATLFSTAPVPGLSGCWCWST